jgi:hypothetical protein
LLYPTIIWALCKYPNYRRRCFFLVLTFSVVALIIGSIIAQIRGMNG